MRRTGLPEPMASLERQSPCGWLGLVVSELGFYELILAGDQAELSTRLGGYDVSLKSAASQRHLVAAGLALDDYFRSPAVVGQLEYDWRGLSRFAVRVLTCLMDVPAGQVISYGELARLAGSPGAARAVGGVMANNPFPILVPCHRVVGADGRMTGYSGGRGVVTKQLLLAHEGFAVSSS